MYSCSTDTSINKNISVKPNIFGRPRLFSPTEAGENSHNSARSGIRNFSNITQNVKISLQHCGLKDNLSRIEDAICKTSDESLVHKLRGLQAILDVLQIETVNTDLQANYLKSFMSFDDAFELFLGFQPGKSMENTTSSDRKSFKELLCHPEYGLCVYIVYVDKADRYYIVLRSDDVDMAHFIEELLQVGVTGNVSRERVTLNNETVHALINSMDSEWDRKVARVLIGANRSNKELNQLGISIENINKSTEEVISIAIEIQNSQLAAEDILMLHYSDKKEKIEKKIEENKARLEKKQSEWSHVQLMDLQDSIDVLQEQFEDIDHLLQQSTPTDQKRFQRMRKRKAESLIEEHRFKKRKLGNQGRPEAIDEEVEEFILKAIEDKATYHGRRKETTMFTNRRVKVRDLKNIANENLFKRGLKPVKSYVTVYNRSRPRNKRSLQAKRHKGKMLFCTRKPPKTEDNSNESTHYQRAHKKNVVKQFFSERSANETKFSFARSIDDKAYVRPGTSEGFEKTRNKRILTPSAEEKSRKLPKYDWPESKVYVTPSTHRLLSKTSVKIDGEEQFLNCDDTHVVFTRPKAYVGSSGTTWANETQRLRCLMPDKFEVNNDKQYSKNFRAICADLKDNVKLFTMMSTDEDIKRIAKPSPEAKYVSYEVKRLVHLDSSINRITSSDELTTLTEAEKSLYSSNVLPQIKEIKKSADTIKMHLESNMYDDILPPYASLSRVCLKFLDVMNNLALPIIKPRWFENSDAGPGVGVSNFEVRFRDAELSILYDRDYSCRVHSARGNSGDNEAERTNSAVGDSIVDGATLQWNRFPKFYNMSDEEISQLTVQDYDTHEQERMEKNAWWVSKELAYRIDAAPVFNEYIHSFVTVKPEEAFFFNREYITQFNKSTGENQTEIPGYYYCVKIMKFIKDHYHVGELYMEFIKDGCKEKDESQHCNWCKETEWRGPVMSRVPEPCPDKDNQGHYMDVFKSSNYTATGEIRPIDQFAPRANLKKLFAEGKIASYDNKAIDDFTKKYIVSKEHAKEYVKHLEELNTGALIRAREKERKKLLKQAKTFSDYNWKELADKGKIMSLTKLELKHYLTHYKLSCQGKKCDWAKRIESHLVVSTTSCTANTKNVNACTPNTDNANTTVPSDTDDDSADEYCSSEDEVLKFGHDTDDEDYDVYFMPQRITTRSGRSATTISSVRVN